MIRNEEVYFTVFNKKRLGSLMLQGPLSFPNLERYSRNEFGCKAYFTSSSIASKSLGVLYDKIFNSNPKRRFGMRKAIVGLLSKFCGLRHFKMWTTLTGTSQTSTNKQ